MTKTLYNQEVEKKGIEKGREEEKIQNAKNLLSMGVESKIVAAGAGLTIEKVEELKKDIATA